MEAARKWVGYLEHRSNDQLGLFRENVGKAGCTIFAWMICRHYPLRNYSGLPWCATFVHSVFLEEYGPWLARKLLGKPAPGTRTMARRFKRRGLLLPPDHIPDPGDIIFLHNGDQRISHCGIVDRVENDTVFSIEGNTTDPSGHFRPSQGGAVALRHRKLTDPLIKYYGCVPRE